MFFIVCGSSTPVRVEHEGHAASWLAGTLVAPNMQGHELSPSQELSAYQSLVARYQKASLASLSTYLHLFRHLKGSFAWGPTL